ncbi:hypothetical protein D3P08_14455 [Paenibacillus nanensis]|uniref:SLH domain-containing protein n=1 Tax=Paenibacillus nanensis TaxID=393251 RepID=A0A3A1UUE9_9BACL|nr:Ig-like domain-containing protein [Paenibacillus nanensis]RIX52168.1 hypothetical protein D3P08_14455 [Paenibacillus nanensis]
MRKIIPGLLLIVILSIFIPFGEDRRAYAAVTMTALPASANLPANAVLGAASPVMLGSQILFTGGQTGSTGYPSQSYMFNPANQTWSSHVPALQLAYHRQSMLSDSRVLVTGGHQFVNGIGYVYNNQPRIYSPFTNSWTNAAALPKNIVGNSQSTLTDGRVLIAGGADSVYSVYSSTLYSNAYIYDPGANEWNEVAPLPIGLYGAVQSTLNDGRVLVTGGQNSIVLTLRSFLYDPSSNTWTEAAHMPFDGGDVFSGHAQITLPNGKVLVMGKNYFYLYDPASNTWKMDSPNPTRLVNASLVALGGDVYVIGGYDETSAVANQTVYKLTFDFDPPTAPVISGVPSGWSTSDIEVAIVAGTDAGTGVNRTEFSLSGAMTQGWTTYDGSPIAVTATGQTTISARTVDNAGNISEVSTAVAKVDKTVPTSPSINRSTTSWSSTDVTFTLTGASDGSGSGIQRQEFSLLGATSLGWTTYTGTVTITAQGETTIQARSVDNVGHVSNIQSTVVFIDRTSPTVPAVTLSETNWSNADVTVTIAPGIDMGGAGVSRTEYRLSGATNSSWATYNGPIKISADGQTVIEARTVDRAGNISTSRTATAKVDKTQPTAPTVTHNAGVWTNAASVSVTVAAGSDATSGAARTEYSLSGATTRAWTAYAAPVAISAEGQTTVHARTIDNAGNVSSTGTSTVSIDRTAPSLPVITPNDSGWSATNLNVSITGADTGSGVMLIEYKLSGATTQNWRTYTVPINITNDGQTVVAARVVDRAGNVSSEALATQSIDKKAPDAPTLTPETTEWSPAASVKVTAAAGADTGGSGADRVEYSLSGATTLGWTDYSVPITITSEGTTTVIARTVDLAGNVGNTASTSVRLDRTKPAAPAVASSSADWTSSDVTMTVTGGSDALSGVKRTEYRLTGATTLDWTTYTGTVTISAEGSTVLEARVVDNAGNASPAVSASARVDRSKPAAPAISYDHSDEWVSAASVSVAVSEGADSGGSGVAKVEYSLSGATSVDWKTYESPILVTAEGETTVSARTVDSAGNRSSLATTVVKLDRTKPAAPSISGSATDWTPDDIEVDVTAGVDALSGTDKTEYRLSGAAEMDWTTYSEPFTIKAEGETTVTVRSIDLAGNLSETAEWTARIDRTAPEAPLILSPEDGVVTNDALPQLRGTAEKGSSIQLEWNGQPLPLVKADNDRGEWSYTPASALADGDYEITAIAVDSAGNESEEAASITLTVDTTPPGKPVILEPAPGAAINNPDLIVKGEAEPHAKVDLYLNEERTAVATTTVKEDGTWTITYDKPLDDGVYVWKAIATDAAGNASPASDTVSWTLDTEAPEAPAIASSSADWTSSDVTMTVTGGSDALSGVKRTEYRLTGATALDWTTYTGTVTISAEGSTTLEARVVDNAGNASPAVSASARIDRSKPAAPAISYDHSDEWVSAASVSVAVSEGADSGGSGVAKVEYSLSGATSVDWKTYESPILVTAEGETTVSARTVDSAGNRSSLATTVVKLDRTKPAAPSINGSATDWTPDDIEVDVTAGVDALSGTDKTEYRLSGAAEMDWTTYSEPFTIKAEGETTVTVRSIDLAGNLSETAEWTARIDRTAPEAPLILSPEDGVVTNDALPQLRGTAEKGSTIQLEWNGQLLPLVKADDDRGEWSYTPASALADGVYEITAIAVDSAGNESEEAASITLTVDTTPPGKPVILEPAPGAAINNPVLVVKGEAEPHAKVDLYLDEERTAVETTTAKEDGTWAITYDKPLDDGVYVWKAIATDAAGNASPASGTVSWTLDTEAPEEPAITSPVGDTVTNDNRAIFTGTAEKGSVVTLLLDGRDDDIEVNVDEDGLWSYSPTSALHDGPHTLQAFATDTAGNAGASSDTVAWTIDTLAPETPIIEAPIEGAHVPTAKPAWSGRAEAGSIISFILDGSKLAEAAAGDNGEWTYVPAEPIADGTHTLAVLSKDAAGNESEQSEMVSFTIDTAKPAIPTVSQPTEGSVTNQRKPVISGISEPGASISIYLDGEHAGDVEADMNGQWSFTPAAELAIGEHAVRALATDLAGNASNRSAEQTFQVVSDNARLGLLELKDVPLGEEFDGATMDYTATAPYFQSSISIAAEPEDAKATIRILQEGTVIDNPVTLSVGTQTFAIEVTAQDGTTVLVYTLKVTRMPFPYVPPAEPEETEDPEEETEKPSAPLVCEPTGAAPRTFGDLAGHWAEGIVTKASGCGIVSGYEDGNFRPDAKLTRAQFIVMLINALAADNMEPGGARTEAHSFADAGHIPAWAADAIAKAVELGIISGYDDGTFRPDAPVTRAEMVTMAARAAGLAPLPSSGSRPFADHDAIPEWAQGFIAAAKELGYVQGKSDNSFAPLAGSTRAEAVALLLRMSEPIA